MEPSPNRESFFRRNMCMILLMAGGLLLRMEYLREFASSELFAVAIGPDVEEYDAWARRIASGGFIPGELPIHAPGYAWLLAGLYRLSEYSVPFVRGFQLCVNWVFWGYCYWFLRDRMNTSRHLHDFFLGLAMFYPVLWFYQAELVSESISPILLVAACMQLWRFDATAKRRHAFAAGVWTALAAVTHPMSLLFTAGEAVRFAFKRKFAALGLFALGGALFIVPVSLVSSLVAGRPVLIQGNGAFNLWLGNRPESSGGCDLRPGRLWHKVHREAACEAARENSSPDAVYLGRVARFWRERPLDALGKLGRKALLVWSADEKVSGADNVLLREYTPLQRYTSGAFALVTILAAAGLVLRILRRKERENVVFGHLLWLTLAFYCVQIVTVTSGRYRLAMLPGLFLLGAYFLSRLDELKRDCKAYYTVFGVILALLVVRFALYRIDRPDVAQGRAETVSLLGEAAYRRGDLNLAKQRFTAARRAIDYPERYDNVLGEIARREKKPLEAAAYFQNARSAAPEDSKASMNLAMLAAENKRYDEADRYFAESFARSGARPPEQLHYNYGYYCEQRNRGELAEHHYRQAVARNPSFRPAWNALGVVLLRSGRVRESVGCFERALALDPGNPGIRRNLDFARRVK